MTDRRDLLAASVWLLLVVAPLGISAALDTPTPTLVQSFGMALIGAASADMARSYADDYFGDDDLVGDADVEAVRKELEGHESD